MDNELEDLPVIHNKGTNNVLKTDSELMNSNEIDNGTNYY